MLLQNSFLQQLLSTGILLLCISSLIIKLLKQTVGERKNKISLQKLEKREEIMTDKEDEEEDEENKTQKKVEDEPEDNDEIEEEEVCFLCCHISGVAARGLYIIRIYRP